MKKGKIVAIVGIPGTGKTTLGNNLAKKFSVDFLEEDWKGIPFFAEARKREPTSFEVCIGFLNLRYEQIQRAHQIVQTGKNVLIDTIFEMTNVYAKPTLDALEYVEFKKVYDIYQASISKPDLYVHLTGDIQVIRQRALDRALDIKNENTLLSLEVMQKSEHEIVDLLSSVDQASVITIDAVREDIRTDSYLENLYIDMLKLT